MTYLFKLQFNACTVKMYSIIIIKELKVNLNLFIKLMSLNY